MIPCSNLRPETDSTLSAIPLHPSLGRNLEIAMTKKHIALIIVGILFVVFIAQNSQLVELRFLFWSVYVSRVFILLGIFFLGVIVGLFIPRLRKKGNKKISGKKG